MKINLTAIKNFLLSQKREIGYRNSYRDWTIIAHSFVLILVLILGGGIAFYFSIDRGIIFNNSSDIDLKPLTVDLEEIKSVSDYYTEREGVIRGLEVGTSTVVDPAL